MDRTRTGRTRNVTPWTERLVLGGQVGLSDPPEWLSHSYDEFRRNVTHPEFPCFFGTQAEMRGEMFYTFVTARDLSHLPATMEKFVELSGALENQRNNFAVFFEPESQSFSHDAFRRLCWDVLQYLHDHDADPYAAAQPDPDDAAWEFCFAGMQMFVVGCSPTYVQRRSRNIGPGMVMLFQPRSVFIDTVTKREIGVEARASVRRRLLAWDDIAAHPDLGVYGDSNNREWKQYFLPDDNAPEIGACPFLRRRALAASQTQDGQPKDAVGQLRRWAQERPDSVAVRFLIDGDTAEATLTYAELDDAASRLAAALRQRAKIGDRVVLAFPSGLEYVVAFYACLYAELIAVPAFAPEPSNAQHAARLSSILQDCSPVLALTDDAHYAALRAFELGTCEAVTFANLVSATISAVRRCPAGAAVAFLQYTSGSTAAPKGVMVTHGNLAANLEVLRTAWSHVDGDVMVTWLPLYHDMGLIGGLLAPVYCGFPVVLMAPTHFLASPARWLKAISRYRGTIAGAPDFAFQLCVDRIGERQIEDIDLSFWRLAWCGSEPVRLSTMQAFAARFGSRGLPPTALYPCYGLAESTLMVSGHLRHAGVSHHSFSVGTLANGIAEADAEGVPLIDCGQAQPGHEIRIVDPEARTVCADGRVGEIWCAGPSVAQGYWQNPKASEEVFGAQLSDGSPQRYLRTGDLGFLWDLRATQGSDHHPRTELLPPGHRVGDRSEGRRSTEG